MIPLLFTSILPLALGIVLSPEIFMLGFGLASSKEKPCLKAWLFLLGGIVGLSIMVTVGIFLHATVSHGPSWPKFWIRASLGTLLYIVGIHSLFKKTSAKKKKHLNLAQSSPQGAFGLGIFITTLNLKVGSFAITAGHQTEVLFHSLFVKFLALSVFLMVSALPLIIPALLESFKPGKVASLMQPFDRLLEQYGKWIVILICFLMGSLLWRHALISMP